MLQLSVKYCDPETVTLVVCPLVTVPTDGLIVHDGAGLGVDENVHAHVTLLGMFVATVLGVAVNVVM